MCLENIQWFYQRCVGNTNKKAWKSVFFSFGCGALGHHHRHNTTHRVYQAHIGSYGYIQRRVITQCPLRWYCLCPAGQQYNGRGLQIHRLLIRCNAYIEKRRSVYPASHCVVLSVTNQFNIIYTILYNMNNAYSGCVEVIWNNIHSTQRTMKNALRCVENIKDY